MIDMRSPSERKAARNKFAVTSSSDTNMPLHRFVRFDLAIDSGMDLESSRGSATMSRSLEPLATSDRSCAEVLELGTAQAEATCRASRARMRS
jgi:hypothetical protein